MPQALAERWQAYQARYRNGGWRAPIFRDMVLADLRSFAGPVNVLDIGCGHGFDGDTCLQRSLADAADHYIGVEPDLSIAPGDHFAHVHRGFFEDVPIEPGSIHVAFAVMVLEHLQDPQRFWDKLRDVLVDGGVFWGFTMDGRHRFCWASVLAERLRIKDLYLRFLRGKRGTARYENYPVHYRCNTPAQLEECSGPFREREWISFARVGQLNYYVPAPLRPFTNYVDRLEIRLNRPGSLLAVRAVK